MTIPDKTRLRKIDTADEEFAVVTYEAVHNGKVLGTVTKFDRPAHKDVPTWKSGRRELKVHNYREIYWAFDPDPCREGYDLRADCVRALERASGVG